VPNPLDEAEDLLLTPEERIAKDLLGEIELEGTFDQLRDKGDESKGE
jgi:hypothetical protein